MPCSLTRPLQVMVALALLITLYAQIVLIPTVAADEVSTFPPYAPLQLPLVSAGIAVAATAQVGMVALWFLLRRAGRGTLFEASALTWTNLLIGALAAALVMTAALCAYVTVTDIPSPSDGMEVIGLWLGSAVAAAAVLALLLLAVVGRQLQAKAVGMHHELASII